MKEKLHEILKTSEKLSKHQRNFYSGLDDLACRLTAHDADKLVRYYIYYFGNGVRKDESPLEKSVYGFVREFKHIADYHGVWLRKKDLHWLVESDNVISEINFAIKYIQDSQGISGRVKDGLSAVNEFYQKY